MSSSMYSPCPDLLVYLRDHSLRETDIQRRLRNETDTLPESGWEVAPEQAQFLSLIVQLIGAKRILELGTFTGHSALAMVMVLPEDGELITCDMVEDYIDIARPYWQEAGVSDRIKCRIAPALVSLQALIEEGEGEKVDLVFIDANKKDYDAYYEYALQLVRLGGVIVLDNMFWGGRVLNQGDTEKSTVTLRALVKKLYVDERISFSLLPMDDGLALAVKR
jgi:predicted O-methyltransferase YrrM